MTETSVVSRQWSLDELRQRLVRYGDLVPCRNAFIDTRNPGSEDKENFTIIGPGVSENPEQFIHISEPHGFNIGAARQPPNCINSQHSHDTAEVFVVHSGEWTLNFGEKGEVKLSAGPGAVASVPTQMFRGFTNVGDKDGFLWVALGSDDPGHVLWAPQVFDMAKNFGMVLMADGSLFDGATGDPLPGSATPMPRTTAEQVAALGQPDAGALARCIVAPDDIPDQPAGPLCGAGVDERLLIAPHAQIDWPHGFTLSRVTLDKGAIIAAYSHDEKEVWFVHAGELDCLAGGGALQMERGDTFSVPEGIARGWRAGESTTAFVVRVGDRLPVLRRA